MSKPIRWGILGVARINDRMMPAWKRISNGVLAGIASRSLEKAQASAKANGIAQAFGSYEAILASPDIDAIYIPLPNHLHGEYARKAAEAGKHVLCEKPLAPTSAEASEIVELFRKKNLKLLDGFFWPHHPRTTAMRKFLDGGHIGRVERVHASFTFKMPKMDLADFRLHPDMGGGALLDVGCYCVYGIRWAFGAEPVRVWATAKYFNGVDVDMLATLWFADGRTAQFDCGFVHPYRQWFEVVGATGTLTVPDMWIPQASQFQVVHNEHTTTETTTVGPSCQMTRMIENMCDAIRFDRPVAPDSSEAVKSLKVMEALLKSAKEERPVDVAP